MKAVPIEWARAIGQRRRYVRVAIIYSDGLQFGITTYGQTREECRSLAKWAESIHGEDAALSMMEARAVPAQAGGAS